ncbi:MAG: hypothetical protein FJ137_06815 [Deltaproteobacteria bacterium]|nr:hypothetical protein [Deltaproteobacteria bacterium]
MLRASLFVLSVLALSAPSLAQSGAAFPGSLEEAAKKFDPTKPTGAPPATPPATPPAPAATSTGEPAEVDGWKIVAVLSERRGPDGKATPQACGYERDVTAERTRDGKLESTKATLVVPCEAGAAGPVAGPAQLRLPTAASTTSSSVPAKPVVAATADAAAVKVDGLVELTVGGALNKDAVVAALQGKRAGLSACQASGTGGRLSLRLDVAADGKVVTVVPADGPYKGTPVGACVSGVLMGATLGRPADGKTATVQLTWAYAPRTATTTAPPPPTTATNVKPAATTAPSLSLPPCKPGEKPKPAAELKPGEVSCVEAAQPANAEKSKGPRPCAEGEKPKDAAELASGEVPCKQMNSERGVAFLKGELAHLGDVQLINARSSFGVGLGVSVIDTTLYAVLRPDLNVKLGAFQLGLGAPLRFETFSWGSVDIFGNPIDDAFGNFGRFRSQDWDQLEDFLRPLRYVAYGKKEDKVYINLNRVNATTIGHGQLVRRYTPNIDIDEDNLFANFDAYGDWGGVELMGGPFPLPRLVGGLAFLKPLGIAQDFVKLTEEGTWLHTALDSWSIGFSYVTDLNSPTGLEGRFNPGDQRRQLAVDPANQFVWRNQTTPIGDAVQGMGIDTEVKLLKLPNVDIKAYADASMLLFPGDSSSAAAYQSFSGAGGTIGSLVRISLGEKPVRPIEEEPDEVQLGKKPREKKAAHALRLRLEGRTFSPTFLPSYWNTLYEVDRFQFGTDANRATLPTKIGFLASKQGGPMRAGYYAELSYAWVDALALTAMFEDAFPLGEDATLRAKNFALHAETAGLGWLQLFATYHYRNFEAGEFDKLFSLATDNEVLFAGVRLQILPIMFLNFATQRAFRLGFGRDDTPGQTDSATGYRYTTTGLQNSWNQGFDVELGWQF